MEKRNLVLDVAQAPTLGGRVASLIEAYWGPRGLRRASDDLDVSHATMSRVVNDHDTEARFLVIDAFKRGLDVPYGWLAGETKEPPPAVDAEDRPLVAGVPRWRRALDELDLDGPMRRELEELPYEVWHHATRVAEQMASKPKAVVAYEKSARALLTDSLNLWSAFAETSKKAIGQPGMAVLLQSHRLKTQLPFAASVGGRGFERKFGGALKAWFDDYHASRRG